jgi:cell division protein FtsA
VAFRIPLAGAEEIKLQHGSAIQELIDKDERFNLSGAAGAHQYGKKDLAKVIEARMEELFLILRQQLAKSGFRDFLGSGIVLTGGASLMDGTEVLAQRIFQLPVRIGKPYGISGLKEVLDSPEYATGVGLVQYGSRCRDKGMLPRIRGRNIFQKIMERMRCWFVR